MSKLDWPLECAGLTQAEDFHWHQSDSNMVLDFHGDPLQAEAVVFSDGNHHMALEQALRRYCHDHGIKDVFYATTPPRVLVRTIQQGGLRLGNLRLSLSPDIFIGPGNVIEQLTKQERIHESSPFMQSRGNVLLVPKNNPKNVRSVADLLRDDVTLFFSHPENETASYQVYRQSLLNIAGGELGESGHDAMAEKIDSGRGIFFGENIHHRELPAALAAGDADAAFLYYHLALRYCRIFPHLFQFIGWSAPEIPLGNDHGCAHHDGNVITRYEAGLMNPRPEAIRLFQYLNSDAVTAIYHEHGLTRP